MNETTPMQVMITAGEESGDALAAELVQALRASEYFQSLPVPAKFFGSGGKRLAEAGVEMLYDLTDKATVGIWEVVYNGITFLRVIDALKEEAVFRRPDLIIVVDNSGFNLRLVHAIKEHVRQHEIPDGPWDPKIVYYISPQVWASRDYRAKILERDLDLLLSIFPFEREWYQLRSPELKVEFVGHPVVDRYPREIIRSRRDQSGPPTNILLLPGSRTAELKNHLPALVPAIKKISSQAEVRFRMVLPNSKLLSLANRYLSDAPEIELQIGGLTDALQAADLAIASSGTVTLECAWFEVPTIVIYKCSWLTYKAAQILVKIPRVAMPNILADRELLPEFIQENATPDTISSKALEWIQNPEQREQIRHDLNQLNQTLGTPGACHRATAAITELFSRQQ